MTDPTTNASTDSAADFRQPGFEDDGDDRPTPKVPDPIVEGGDVDAVAIMNALRGVIDPELGDNLSATGISIQAESLQRHPVIDDSRRFSQASFV